MRLRRHDGPLLRIGHRGAAALAPANSLRALELALEAGVDIVEIDVLGLPGRGLVLSHSSRDVAPDPLPLDDALAFLAQHASVGLLADVKNGGYERELVEAIRSHGLVDRALVSTMDLSILREVKRLEPGVSEKRHLPAQPGAGGGAAAGAVTAALADRRSRPAGGGFGSHPELPRGDQIRSRALPRSGRGRLRLDGQRPGSGGQVGRAGGRRGHH